MVGVNVIGFVSARLGLGTAARQSIASLVASGASVSVVDVTLPDGRSGADLTWAHLNIRDSSALPHDVNLVHLNPMEASQVRAKFPNWFAGKVNAIVPFWELSQVPVDWFARLAAFDVVLAPTEHIASVLRNALPVPIRPYPLGVGTVLPAEAGRARFGLPDEKFIFACTFDTDSGLNRKNSLGMIRAFDLAFREDRDVMLVLKTNGLTRHPELDHVLARLPADRYRIVHEYLSYDDVLALYGCCDAFLSLHRAEGLGLGLLEAMTLGKPVIATGWSGNIDFMDETCAALVRYSLVPVIDPHPEYQQSRFAATAYWAEADISHAVLQMRRVRSDAEYRRNIAEMAQKRARTRNEGFAQSGLRLLQALADERAWQLANAY